MVYIYTYIWFIFVVNVGKQTIHGSYDIWDKKIRDNYIVMLVYSRMVGPNDGEHNNFSPSTFLKKIQLKYHHGFFQTKIIHVVSTCRFIQQNSSSPRLNLPKTNSSHLKLVFLDGGFKYFVFSPRSLGKWSNLNWKDHPFFQVRKTAVSSPGSVVTGNHITDTTHWGLEALMQLRRADLGRRDVFFFFRIPRMLWVFLGTKVN